MSMLQSFASPSKSSSDQHRYRACYIAGFIAIAVALLVWFPALFTPFWGDDYFFLQNAKEARFADTSWFAPFFSDSNTAFWRPLSMDLPWRFIEDVLKGDPILAHLLSAVCWLMSVLAVACLGYRFALAMQWQPATLIALITGFLYGFHGVHILVLHWVSAINSAILVTFVSCALTAWITTLEAAGIKQKVFSALTLVFLWMALFSKEIAIVTPVLMLLLNFFIFGFKRPGATLIVTFILCLASCLCWFYFFQQFTPIRYSAYEILLGSHIAKNVLTLLAWLLNVPREALRLLSLGETIHALLWIGACLAPMLLFIALVFKKIITFLTLFQLLIIGAFCAVAYAPYFLLREQSYEYYAAIALILPAIILARGVIESRYMYLALVCFTVSSSISIIGNRMLDYPSLLGRAMWAERQFEYLSSHTPSSVLPDPMLVRWENYHQFAAIEVSGLAWRLGIPREQVVLTSSCPAFATYIFVQNDEGDFRWENCP